LFRAALGQARGDALILRSSPGNIKGAFLGRRPHRARRWFGHDRAARIYVGVLAVPRASL